MKKTKYFVFGGIQNKIFNLILITVLLMLGVLTAVTLYRSKILSDLTKESGRQQQEAISEITGMVMNNVVSTTLQRSNKSEAQIINNLFKSTSQLVSFMSEGAELILAYSDYYTPHPCEPPNPENDGLWTVKVLYADGVDPSDPELAAKVGLLANLADVMIPMCTSYNTANAYIALPEGAFLCISDIDSSWFQDGKLIHYDPRERSWYQQAVDSGVTIFTDGEYDADTGEYCIECASAVYGPDGEFVAVVGMDLYMDEIEQVFKTTEINGEFQLLINQQGRAVLEPQAMIFPMSEEDKTGNLRLSKNPLLAQIADDAVSGILTGVLVGELEDGEYFLTATPIPSTSWALISAYSKAVAGQSGQLLIRKTSEIQQMATDQYLNAMSEAKISTTLLLILLTLLILGGSVLLGTRIVKPLNTITNRISNLREGNLEFKMEDAYRTGDEVEELAKSFAAISHKTVEYLDTVKRVTAEKERLGAELSLATRIQASMLPHIFPAFPERSEFDIFASMDPAKEVGGDFYDFFLVDEDHLGLVMADVSGKGVPAALFMMASKIIIQSCAMLGNSPCDILTKANEAICSNNPEDMFVTVWVGILEISTGKLVAANAGHEYPILKKPDGSFEVFKDKHGFVIGGMPGMQYREYEINLEPGSKLFLYTDGVPEATSADQELFGLERMLEALNEAPDVEPKEILRNVRRHVDAFVKDAEQFDDLTMLCAEYYGKDNKRHDHSTQGTH